MTQPKFDFRAAPPAFDAHSHARALEHHAALAKPAGSLGRLEELAAFYAGAHGCFPPPAPERPTLALFAADHGVTAEGVSAFPPSVTAAVVANIGAGGSAINALARALGLELCLVDVGLLGDLPAGFQQTAVRVQTRPVARGTRNLALGPAMTLEQAEQALAIGAETADELVDSGARLLGVGEIGIGNTTCAAAIVACCTGSKAETVVGPGAGLDSSGLARKVQVVERALARKAERSSGLELLADLGGFELAAMAGFMIRAAQRRVPVVLDGVVTNAAALIAVKLAPGARDYLLAAHGSTEPGAHVALEELRLKPLALLGMRLGEGSGAALGLSLLKASVDVLLGMATLESVIARAGLASHGS